MSLIKTLALWAALVGLACSQLTAVPVPSCATEASPSPSSSSTTCSVTTTPSPMTLCKGLDRDSREWILYLPRQCEHAVLIAMSAAVVAAAIVVGRHLALVACVAVSLVLLFCVIVGGIFNTFIIIFAILALAAFALGAITAELADKALDAAGVGHDTRFYRLSCDKK